MISRFARYTANMVRRVRTIDAHVAGEPLRLIVEGCPTPVGATMLAKREWACRRLDGLRRALLHEPRGHTDMYGAVLTDSVEPGSAAGVLFMHHAGFSTMCGHGLIGVTTVAIERGLLHLRDGSAELSVDTPAGTVRIRPIVRGTRVTEVSFVNVPSFVLEPGLAVRVGARDLRVDVAFGGAFYAIVDSEAAGVPLRTTHLSRLRELGQEVKAAVESRLTVVHPTEEKISGVYGTIFTGPPDSVDADLRNVTVFADGQVDRSPCGSGTAAVMAVLDAMGLLSEEQSFVSESLLGTRFLGWLEHRTEVAERPAIVPRIKGSAWITGEHEFWIDDDDPLKEGFSF